LGFLHGMNFGLWTFHELSKQQKKFDFIDFWLPYNRGGQLVFGWDRLENFLLPRDRPVGEEVTSTKCQS